MSDSEDETEIIMREIAEFRKRFDKLKIEHEELKQSKESEMRDLNFQLKQKNERIALFEDMNKQSFTTDLLEKIQEKDETIIQLKRREEELIRKAENTNQRFLDFEVQMKKRMEGTSECDLMDEIQDLQMENNRIREAAVESIKEYKEQIAMYERMEEERREAEMDMADKDMEFKEKLDVFDHELEMKDRMIEELNEDMERVLKEKMDTVDQLDEAEQKNITLMDEIDKLENHINNNKEMMEMRELIEELKDENARLKSINEDLEAEKHKISDSHSTAETNYDKILKEHRVLKADYKRLVGKNQEQYEKIEQDTNKISELNTVVNDIKKQLRLKETKLVEFQEKYNKSVEEKNQIVSEMESTIELKTHELTTQVAELEYELNEQKAGVRDSQLNPTKKRDTFNLGNLESELNALDTEMETDYDETGKNSREEKVEEIDNSFTGGFMNSSFTNLSVVSAEPEEPEESDNHQICKTEYEELVALKLKWVSEKKGLESRVESLLEEIEAKTNENQELLKKMGKLTMEVNKSKQRMMEEFDKKQEDEQTVELIEKLRDEVKQQKLAYEQMCEQVLEAKQETINLMTNNETSILRLSAKNKRLKKQIEILRKELQRYQQPFSSPDKAAMMHTPRRRSDKKDSDSKFSLDSIKNFFSNKSSNK